MTRDNRPQSTQRESIWAIDPKWRNTYLAIFTSLNTINIARVVWYETTQAAHAGWSPATDAILESVGKGSIGIAGFTITVTEAGRFAMVLGGALQEVLKRRRERQIAEARAEAWAEARAEGRAEGRAETWAEVNDRWREWNSRRLSALAKGEPFDEPTPDDDAPPANGR